MEKELVPYELAAKLKAIGFNEPCMFVHDTWGNTKNWTEDGEGEHRNSHINASIYYSAPLFQQVFRWFDYSTDWSGFIVPSKEEGCFDWWIQNYEDPNYLTIESDDWYRGREEAELACLEKLIELVEQKEK